MAIYSKEVKIYATAYIKAGSAEEAEKLFRKHFGTEEKAETAELTGDYIRLDDEGDVCISPAVTFYGGGPDNPGFVQEDEDEDESEEG